MPASVVAAVAAEAIAGQIFANVMVSALFRQMVTAAIGFVLKGVISSALGSNEKKRDQGADPVAMSRGRMVTIRQPISSWAVIYGQVRTGGVLTFAYVSTDQEYIHLVITLAGHVCAEIGDIYLNDEVVPLDANGEATGRYAGYVRVKKSLGDESGQPFPDLVSESNGEWTDSWRQTGRTKIYVRLRANPDLFPTGIPTVTAIVRGAKVYDPRTGATGWSDNAALCVNHYVTNSTFGVGATYADEIDEDTLVAAANAADEAVSLAASTTTFTADASTDALTLAEGSKRPAPGDGVRVSTTGSLPSGLSAATTYYVITGDGGAIKLATTLANARAGTAINITSAGSGTHTLTYYDEPRYRVGGLFQANAEPKKVIGLLLAAMGGKAVNVGGLWHTFAGAYEAPTVTLDEDDLAGGLKVQTLLSRRENANGIKGIFTDPNAFWQPTSFPALASSTYLAEDGERVWKDIDLAAFVTSGTQAQRLAKMELLSIRQGLTVEGDFKLSAWRAMTGRTVALTNSELGWSAKAFEVVESQFSFAEDGTLGVHLVLRETAAAVFDWSTSEEQTVDIAPNTSLPALGTVSAPGAPAVTEDLYETRDGRGVAAKAIVTWGASSYPYGPTYQLEYKLSAATEWTVVPITRSTTLEILDLATDTYQFRVKAFGVTGAGSDYSDTTTRQILGLGARPASPTGLALQAIGGQALITFTQAADLDVKRGGRVLVRHCEDTVSPTWEESFSIGNEAGYAGDAVYVLVPLKAGTYLLKFEDAVGQQSASAATIDTRQASVLTFSTVGSVTEDSAFSGAHSNTVVDAGTLKLTGTGLFDSITALDSVSSLDSYGGITTSGTYTFAAGIDLGSVMNVRLTGTLVGSTVNVLDAVDDRTGDVDDWLDFDGSSGGGSTDAYIESRQTDDNPSGSPTWTSWVRLDVAEKRARGFQFRLQMTSSDPAYNQTITQLRVAAEQAI